MLFWSILLFVTVAVLAVWILGVGLVSAFHVGARSQPVNILVGTPLLALAIWLPFAFGWVSA